jgi:hypothetical protein
MRQVAGQLLSTSPQEGTNLALSTKNARRLGIHVLCNGTLQYYRTTANYSEIWKFEILLR